jgi:hypothetical protein
MALYPCAWLKRAAKPMALYPCVIFPYTQKTCFLQRARFSTRCQPAAGRGQLPW